MVYDWTGFYLGVNAGVGIGRNNQTLAVPDFPSFEQSYLSAPGRARRRPGRLQLADQFGIGSAGSRCRSRHPGRRHARRLHLPARLPDRSTRHRPVRSTARLVRHGSWPGRHRHRSGAELLHRRLAPTATSRPASPRHSPGLASTVTSNQTRGGWTVRQRRRSGAGRQLDRQDRVSLRRSRQPVRHLRIGGTPPQTLDTEIRENIFRVGLNYRIGGNSRLRAGRDGELGRLLSRRQLRRRHRAQPQHRLPLRRHPNEQFNLSPGRHQRRRAGRLQLAGGELGVRLGSRHSGHRTRRTTRTCVLFCQGLNDTYANYDSKLPWFGTVRGRLGYSVGSTLFYATGGYAYGGVKTNIDSAFLNGPVSTRLSATKGGWTAGAGIETPFTLLGLFGPNWTSKTEYLYIDLGSTVGHHRRSRRPLGYDNQRQEPRSSAAG